MSEAAAGTSTTPTLISELIAHDAPSFTRCLLPIILLFRSTDGDDVVQTERGAYDLENHNCSDLLADALAHYHLLFETAYPHWLWMTFSWRPAPLSSAARRTLEACDPALILHSQCRARYLPATWRRSHLFILLATMHFSSASSTAHGADPAYPTFL